MCFTANFTGIVTKSSEIRYVASPEEDLTLNASTKKLLFFPIIQFPIFHFALK